MKNFFFAAAAVIMALFVVGCEKSGKTDVNLESSWAKEAKEHPFLSNFPEYNYDFQGTYQKVFNVETYALMDRKGSEARLDEYKAKLTKAGFSEETLVGNSSLFTKTNDKGKFSANPSYVSGIVAVSYSFEPAE